MRVLLAYNESTGTDQGSLLCRGYALTTGIQHFTNLAYKRFTPERLSEQARSGSTRPPLFTISRHVQDSHLWIACEKSRRQLRTAHLRQYDIGDEQVKLGL